MARINIEDKWWMDPRRSALRRLLNNSEMADGAAVELWRVAQEYWKDNRSRIPKQCFDLLPSASELLRVGLAVLEGASVYVKGASEQFDWMHVKREAGRKGGKKSVEKRRETDGTAQPISKQTRSKLEAEPKQTRSKTKHTEPSSSSSSSSSFSLKEEETLAANATSVAPTPWNLFEKHWKERYPKADLIRNQKVNGQLANLKGRIPQDQLEPLIAYYVRSNNDYYVKNMHQVGQLLADCEKLVAEMTAGPSVPLGQLRMVPVHQMTKQQLINQRNEEVFKKEMERAEQEAKNVAPSN